MQERDSTRSAAAAALETSESERQQLRDELQRQREELSQTEREAHEISDELATAGETSATPTMNEGSYAGR